jgi:hypothetical protein
METIEAHEAKVEAGACAICGCNQDEACPDCLCHPEIEPEDLEDNAPPTICGPCLTGDHEECWEKATIFPDSGPCECGECGGGITPGGLA